MSPHFVIAAESPTDSSSAALVFSFTLSFDDAQRQSFRSSDKSTNTQIQAFRSLHLGAKGGPPFCLFSFVVAKISLVLRQRKSASSALSWISHKKVLVFSYVCWKSLYGFLGSRYSVGKAIMMGGLQKWFGRIMLTRNFVCGAKKKKASLQCYKVKRRKFLWLPLRIQFLT